MRPTVARRRLVVDACIVLKWQLDDEDHLANAVALRDDSLIEETVELNAPTLLVYEIANGIHSAARRSRLTPGVAREALSNLMDCDIQLHAPDVGRILSLAQQHGITAYDAAYVDLADRLRVELWTADRPLYDAVAGRCPWVRWITDYAAVSP